MQVFAGLIKVKVIREKTVKVVFFFVNQVFVQKTYLFSNELLLSK